MRQPAHTGMCRWFATRKGDSMGRILVMNSVTLDGVMQGPGRPDEDPRDGFMHGGWAIPFADEAMAAKMGERMGEDRAFLFGRRTYEEVLASWDAQGGPFKDALSSTQVRRFEQPRGNARVAELDAAARRRSGRCREPTAKLGYEPRDHGERRADPITDGRRPDRRVPADDPPAGAGQRTAIVHRRRRGIAPPGREQHHEQGCADGHLSAHKGLRGRVAGGLPRHPASET